MKTKATSILLFFLLLSLSASIYAQDTLVSYRLNLVKNPITKRYGYAFKAQNINSPIRGLTSTAINALGSSASLLVGKKDAENIDWAIPPQYDDAAKKFSENLAMVKVNGKVGFIDIYNRFVIKPVYDDCNDMDGFHQGLAAVKQNGRWGYINKRGVMVIEPQFEEADAFEDCLIAAVKKDDHWGAIDIMGNVVVPFEKKMKAQMVTLPVSNKAWNAAKAEAKEKRANGSFDKRLREIQTVNEEINDMIRKNDMEDLVYQEVSGDSTSIRIIDQYGREIVPEGFDAVTYDSNSRAYIVQRDNLYGAFLYNGLRLIAPCFDSMSFFKNGQSTVTSCGMTGWIDLEGHLSPDLLSSIVEAGMSQEKSGNKVKAREYYERSLLIYPEYAPAYNNIALLDIANKDYNKGMRKLKLAHELDPENTTIADNLEWAKQSRKERRAERWSNGFAIAGAIVGIAATTYSTYSAISNGGGQSFSGTSTSYGVSDIGDFSSTSTSYGASDVGDFSSSSGSSSNSSSSSKISTKKCKFCAGSGKCSGSKRCRGSGKCNYCNGDKYNYTAGKPHDCGACHATGRCSFCGGSGNCKHCNGTGNG